MTQEQVAEAFSRHDFRVVYPHLRADVSWTMAGERQALGRDAVISVCEDSSAYLDTVTTRFTSFRVLAGPDFVVTDGTAEYTDAEGALSVVASCDIYRFEDDQLVEITSYTVEVDQQ